MPRNYRDIFKRHYGNGEPLVTVANYKPRREAFSTQERAEYDRIMKTRRRGKLSVKEWAEIEREAVELVVMQRGCYLSI